MSDALPRTFGPYTLLDVLGRGGKGTAYLAVPLDPKAKPRLMVLKILHEDAAKDALDRARFDHEAKLAVALNIKALATVYEMGIAGETPYIAMELVRGMTLSRLLAALAERKAHLLLEDALSIIVAALSGVTELHEAKDERGRALETIHRDLSPGNLVLERGGRVRILDLGIGRSRLQATKTQTGVIMGTPGYMSPEQVLSAPIAQQSDVYTIGAIFWELLSGRRYIARGDLIPMLTETVKRVFEPPSAHRPGLSSRFDEVCRRALDQEPERRYPSAREFLRAIEALRDAVREPMSPAIVSLASIYEADAIDDAAALAHEQTPTEDQRMTVIADTVVVARRTEVKAQPPIILLVLGAAVVGSLAVMLIAKLTATAVTPALLPEPEPEIRATQLPGVEARKLEPEAPAVIEDFAPPKRTEPKPRPAIDRSASEKTERPVAERSLDQLVTRINQLARLAKRARPQLAPKIDELINASLFEAAAGDTPPVRARLEEIATELERLAAP